MDNILDFCSDTSDDVIRIIEHFDITQSTHAQQVELLKLFATQQRRVDIKNDALGFRYAFIVSDSCVIFIAGYEWSQNRQNQDLLITSIVKSIVLHRKDGTLSTGSPAKIGSTMIEHACKRPMARKTYDPSVYDHSDASILPIIVIGKTNVRVLKGVGMKTLQLYGKGNGKEDIEWYISTT
jgi:hypothetical protein